MKNLSLIIAVLFITAGFLTACSDSDNKTETADQKTNTESTTDKKTEEVAEGEVVMVNVPSIQCNSCKRNITKALKGSDGINDVDVDVKGKTVKVTYDKAKTDLSKIESTITAAGYDANDKKADKEAYEMLDDCCKKPEDQKDKDMHM